MEELVSGERGVSGGSGDWLKGEVVVGWGGEGKGARQCWGGEVAYHMVSTTVTCQFTWNGTRQDGGF